MRTILTSRSLLFALLCVPLCLGQTCLIDLGGSGGDNGDDDTPPTSVRLVLVNESVLYALDPEIYISTTPVSNADTELFIAEKRVATAGDFGFDRILPLQDHTIERACDQAAVIGTKGGSFVNVDGAEVGRGTLRVLTLGGQVQCGDKITLRYHAQDSGFATDLAIE